MHFFHDKNESSGILGAASKRFWLWMNLRLDFIPVIFNAEQLSWYRTFAFNLPVTNEFVLPRLTQRGVKFFHKKVESFQEVSGDVEPRQRAQPHPRVKHHPAGRCCSRVFLGMRDGPGDSSKTVPKSRE